MSYVYNNLKYPPNARSNNIEGLAIFRFVVNTDGTITEIKALRGLCQDIVKEGISLIRKMPRWHPGMQDGQPVQVKFNLPVRFRIE